jgi:hypothetical protein
MQYVVIIHSDAACVPVAAQRKMRTNLMYPASTEEPAVAGIGWIDNRHLRDFVESIVENLGDPSGDVNESGSRGLETTPEILGCVRRESAWP